jgi:hypothetical protein
MSYRPSESFVPEQRKKQSVSAVYCDKNLEQRINSECCVKIGNSGSETVAILTLAYGEYAMLQAGRSRVHSTSSRNEYQKKKNNVSGE